MADDIRSLSAALAGDPSSLAYVELAEALRRGGRLNEALRVAMHGLGRHAQHADGYDCLARIHSDMGQLDEARWAWEKSLAIAPEHTGALKGIAFLFFKQGDRKRAADALEHALAADPTDGAARRALEAVRGGPAAAATATPPADPVAAPAPAAAPVPAAPVVTQAPAAPVPAATASMPVAAPPVLSDAAAMIASLRAPIFDGLEGATADLLLLDARGLVVAGGLAAVDGTDVSELAAAALAGVSGEATRTADYLGMGAWGSIVAEAETAHIVLSPVHEGALLLVRRDRSVPVGLALRFAERARGAARRWLEGQGA